MKRLPEKLQRATVRGQDSPLFMGTGNKMKRRVFFATLLSGIAATASLLFVPDLNAADEKEAAPASAKKPVPGKRK